MATSVGQCTAAEYQKILLILSDPALATTVCDTFNVTALGDTGAVLAYTLQQVYPILEHAAEAQATPALHVSARSSRVWLLNTCFAALHSCPPQNRSYQHRSKRQIMDSTPRSSCLGPLGSSSCRSGLPCLLRVLSGAPRPAASHQAGRQGVGVCKHARPFHARTHLACSTRGHPACTMRTHARHKCPCYSCAEPRTWPVSSCCLSSTR